MDNRLYIKINKFYEEKSDGKEFQRIIEGYAAKSGPDRTSVYFKPEAFKSASEDLKTNSTVFLDHNYQREIGKVLVAKGDDEGLWVKILISQSEDEVWVKITEGILNSFSVGFSVLEYEKEYDAKNESFIYWVLKAEFFDVSVVGLPANIGAKISAYYIEKSFQDAIDVLEGGKNMKEKFEGLIKDIKLEASVILTALKMTAEPVDYEKAVLVIEQMKSVSVTTGIKIEDLLTAVPKTAVEPAVPATEPVIPPVTSEVVPPVVETVVPPVVDPKTSPTPEPVVIPKSEDVYTEIKKISDIVLALGESIKGVITEMGTIKEQMISKETSRQILAEMLSELPDVEDIKRCLTVPENTVEIAQKEFDGLSNSEKMKLVLMKQNGLLDSTNK